MNHYISSEGRRVQPSISNVYLMMPISKYNTCGVWPQTSSAKIYYYTILWSSLTMRELLD